MKTVYIIIASVLLQACAFTDAKLQVKHNDTADFSGPLSEAPPLSFAITKLTDERADQARIGWKKNGYGANTADITTADPVEKIVKDAIETGLVQNGHSVTDDGRVEIQGTLNTFWFETDINFWTVEFTGNVECNLTFVDKKTGEAFYSSSYSGTHSDKTGGGLNKTWERVMSQSVDKLIEDIVFDEDLVEALSELQ